MDFFVIIPVFNAAEKIERTIVSLQEQSSVLSNNDRMRCLICDGGSNDETLDIISRVNDERISVLSEPDNGMYDALSKGLAQASGDICTYLPAGETFSLQAFSIVSEMFKNHTHIKWLTGRSVTRNEQLQITDSFLPHPYRRKYIDCGMYGTRLPCIQQESTFWRCDLNAEFDLEVLKTCKLAGDYYLWRCLAQKHELYVVNSELGAFTIEDGQLSKQHPGAYRRELRQLRRNPTFRERFNALMLRQVTKRIRPSKRAPRQLRYDHSHKIWVLNE